MKSVHNTVKMRSLTMHRVLIIQIALLKMVSYVVVYYTVGSTPPWTNGHQDEETTTNPQSSKFNTLYVAIVVKQE